MKKYFLPLILCFSLLSSTAVFAAPVSETAASNIATMQEKRELSYVSITELLKENGKLVGFRATDMDEKTVAFAVNKDSLVMDCMEGDALALSDLETGAGVYVFHPADTSAKQTQPLFAEAIVTNIPMDVGCPMLHTVEQVDKTQEGIKIVTDDGGLHLFTKNSIPVVQYGSGATRTLEDIKVGSRVFAWYPMVLESYPAQTHPTKLSLLPDTTEITSVMINGKATDLTCINQNGAVCVPLRKTAEALGCSVSWDKATRTTILSNETRKMTIALGRNLYISATTIPNMVGMTAPQTLGSAPFLDESGILYVPAEAFSVLVGYEVQTADGVLTIKKIK